MILQVQAKLVGKLKSYCTNLDFPPWNQGEFLPSYSSSALGVLKSIFHQVMICFFDQKQPTKDIQDELNKVTSQPKNRQTQINNKRLQNSKKKLIYNFQTRQIQVSTNTMGLLGIFQVSFFILLLWPPVANLHLRFGVLSKSLAFWPSKSLTLGLVRPRPPFDTEKKRYRNARFSFRRVMLVYHNNISVVKVILY